MTDQPYPNPLRPTLDDLDGESATTRPGLPTFRAWASGQDRVAVQ